MSTSADELVADYLDRLERALAEFPSARRRELVQEISEHIADARAALESETEADVRNLLDRMGEPADIAAEAREAPAVPPAAAAAPARRRSSALDVAALILLLVGGVVFPVGSSEFFSSGFRTAGRPAKSSSGHSSSRAAWLCPCISRLPGHTRKVAVVQAASR